MSNEKSTSKTKSTRSGKPMIIFLCALLIISWCFFAVNMNKQPDKTGPQPVTGNTAEKLERISADFMSYMCDLDFKNASACLEHPDMSDNLTSELTKNVISAFADSFIYESDDFDTLRNSEAYTGITQKTLDFIKESSSYEITSVKHDGEIYYVTVDLKCVESSDLLNKLAENTNPANSFSPALESEAETESDSINTSAEVFNEISKTLDDILLDTEKEKISITLKLIESNDTFKITDLTDMNFIKFFIQ